MKKVLIFLGLATLVVFIYGCGGGNKQLPPEEPPTVVDTTPPPPPPPKEEPPPPPPEIKEGDFVTVYFDFDKYNIRNDQMTRLETDARVLKEFPDAVVKLEGHCDERGTVEYNLALGDKRANAVRKYLMDLGISGDRLQTISYGEERPVDPGHNEAAWAKNRRVEFRVIKK